MWEVLMVSLSPPPRDWTDAIADTAEMFMNARVCFFEAVVSEDDPYDPITGIGKEFEIRLLWHGKARVQHLRSPTQFATDYQAGANRAFRFQAGRNAGVPFLPEGIKARVLDSGTANSTLELLSYVTNSAVNASHQAVTTIELTSTMRKVDWGWDVDELGVITYR